MTRVEDLGLPCLHLPSPINICVAFPICFFFQGSLCLAVLQAGEQQILGGEAAVQS